MGTVVEEENEEDAADWPKSILHPFAVFRTIWDSISAIAIVYSAIFVPYRMAFELVPTGGEWWFDRIVDISFMIDIPLTFNTAYYDAEKEEMVTDRARINENYLKGWFVPDFLATFPFDSVGKLFVDPEEADSLRVLKMIRLLRLLKIMRIVKMSRLLTKIQEAAQIKSGIMFSIKFSLMCSACAHYLACGWYLRLHRRGRPAGDLAERDGGLARGRPHVDLRRLGAYQAPVELGLPVLHRHWGRGRVADGRPVQRSGG